MQARRIRPQTGHLDRRRLAAAGLSAVLPGLGQMVNGRARMATWLLAPSLLLIATVLVVARTQSPTRVAAWAVAPAVLGTLLTLNLVLLAWRLFAVVHAFLDTRWAGPTGRLGVIGIALIALAVIAPHALIWHYGSLAGDAFGKVFGGQVLSATASGSPDPRPTPASQDRINVLLIGVDTTSHRTETLTDTMMVVSLDPVGHTVSMVSLPRDMVSVPLGNGDVYGPKLNSLLAYANSHPADFPRGGIRTLEDAVGALLGIPIDYYARMDFAGFVDMVDAVGGVDVKVKKAFSDPGYDGYGRDGQKGFSVTVGMHHFDGAEALAYARVRKATGESDFTRADRQQQILVALKNGVADGGSLFFELPALLKAVGETVVTDLPVDRLPELAAIMDEVHSEITRAVINHPLVATKQTRYGSSLVPDVPGIRAMAAALFSTPGVAPEPWPTPKPTKAPKPTPTPKASTTP